MKKLLFIIATAAIFSCTPDDDPVYKYEEFIMSYPKDRPDIKAFKMMIVDNSEEELSRLVKASVYAVRGEGSIYIDNPNQVFYFDRLVHSERELKIIIFLREDITPNYVKFYFNK
jgi:hypothetical protein